MTDLSEVQLKNKFSEIIIKFEPFLLLSMEQGLPIIDYRKNERKFESRRRRREALYSIDEITEISCKDLQVDDIADELIDRIFVDEISPKLYDAISHLTNVQKERIIAKFWKNLSNRQIAKMEGRDKKSIDESICKTLIKIKKFL